MDGLIAKAQTPMADPRLESWAAGEPYRRFLYWLILARRPAAVVELGVDVAQTSALMAAAAHQIGAPCYGVDPKGKPGLAYELERDFGYRFLFCDSLGAVEVVRGLLAGRKVGVVFQDTTHHAEHQWVEWLYWQPLLAPDYVWVVDDVTPSFKMPDEPRGMEGFFARLPGRKRLWAGLHVGSIVGVVEP